MFFQSKRVPQTFSEILCLPLDSFSVFFEFVQISGLKSVLGYDTQFCQDLQLLETRFCCSAFFGLFVLSSSFRYVFRSRYPSEIILRIDGLGLLRSHYGQHGNLCVIRDRIGWFDLVRYSNCSMLVDPAWHWVWQKQTRCLSRLVYWRYSPCCVPLWWVIKENSNSLCCPRSNQQNIASKSSWSLAVAWLAPKSTGVVRRRKWMRSCVVLMTILLRFMKCNPRTYPVKVFININSSKRVRSLRWNLSVDAVVSFCRWLPATYFWKFAGGLLFKSAQISSSDRTNIGFFQSI